MRRLEHTIVLHSGAPLAGRMPPREFGAVISHTADLALHAVRMRFEGVSVRGGRRPDWLKQAADIRYLHHEGNGDGLTRLFYDAPSLGETAPDTVWQQSLFAAEAGETALRKEDSALDLLADAIQSVRAANRDSRLYDDGLLKDIRGLHSSFGRVFQKADLFGNRVSKEKPAVADMETMINARKLAHSTPKPRKVAVLGKLDMIRHSTSMFGLVVQGVEVACFLRQGEVGGLKPMLGESVLVQGDAVFRPSGKVLRIEADHFERGSGKSLAFEKLPRPMRAKPDRRALSVPQGPKSGINAIYGILKDVITDEQLEALIGEAQ